MNTLRKTCLIKLKDSLQRILSNGSGILVLSKNDQEINLIDLFRELNDVTNTKVTAEKIKIAHMEEGQTPDYGLSNREKEILALILEEYTSYEIGNKLFISVRTVDLHRSSLLAKLGVKNSLGLARVAYKFNLV